MDNNYEKDILEIPAYSEEEAKKVAKETLQFLNKKGIGIVSAKREGNKNKFYVEVCYLNSNSKVYKKI